MPFISKINFSSNPKSYPLFKSLKLDVKEDTKDDIGTLSRAWDLQNSHKIKF